MRGKGIYYLLASLLLISIEGKTQTIKTNILPEGYQKAQIQNGDTIAVGSMDALSSSNVRYLFELASDSPTKKKDTTQGTSR